MSSSLKYIPTPDPRVMRLQMNAKARAGEIKKTPCPHPVSGLEQFVDEIVDKGRYQRPTNLFQCSLCHHLLRIVDFTGKEASDG